MPTNVVIAPAAVFAEAGGSGAVVTRLSLGKAIGYVEPKALAGLQLGSGIAWRRKKVITRARGKGRARRRSGCTLSLLAESLPRPSRSSLQFMGGSGYKDTQAGPLSLRFFQFDAPRRRSKPLLTKFPKSSAQLRPEEICLTIRSRRIEPTAALITTEISPWPR
jgi:hypothetical protein